MSLRTQLLLLLSVFCVGSCAAENKTSVDDGIFTFAKDEVATSDCIFPDNTKFLRHGNSAEQVSDVSGNLIARVNQGQPVNQLEIVDLESHKEFLIVHPTSTALVSEVSVTPDGRYALFSVRPRGGMNASEIYEFDLETEKGAQILGGGLNYGSPVRIEDDVYFSFIAMSGIAAQPQRTFVELLNREPIVWIPSVTSHGTTQFLARTNENRFGLTIEPEHAIRVSPISAGYVGGTPYGWFREFSNGKQEVEGVNLRDMVPEMIAPQAKNNAKSEARTEQGAIQASICLKDSLFAKEFPYETEGGL